MTKTIKSFAMLAVAGLVILSACTEKKAAEVTLQVKTQNGILKGFEEDGVKKFLGVPFAQAPVGELRWKVPQPMQAWEGVREALGFGDDPMQPNVFGDMAFRGPKRSEDCLYLNIWTTATTTADALPVLIYFNGGGLMAGSGSEPRYDGSSIAKEGVIGVTANYREGVFGFFAHPELTEASDYKGSGNYGFLDQVAAIQWVKDNIAAFGGDPAKITIVGESAGSFSVSLLMCSPLSKNNLAGAMLSSGAEVLPYKPASQAEADAAGAELLKKAGIASLADAMAMNADSLQKILPPRGMANVVLDGYFMKESADEVFEKGEQAQVPLLAGWNSLEGHPAQSLGGQAPTLQNYKNAMKAQFGDMTDEIFKAYGIETDEDVLSQKGLDLASDSPFTAITICIRVLRFLRRWVTRWVRWLVVYARRLPKRRRLKPSSPRLLLAPSIRLISSMQWVPSTPTSTTTGRKRTTPSRSCSSLTMPTSARPVIPTARVFPSGLPSPRRIWMLRQ